MRTLTVIVAILTLGLAEAAVTALQPYFLYIVAAGLGAGATAAAMALRRYASADLRWARQHRVAR
jgi:hypothetical protein